MDMKKYAAEAIGTFWLTFAGCGSAVIAAGFPQVGIGLVGVSLAFGLSVVTMAYAIGHISGCHLNPAVTIGLAAGGRFPTGQILPYVIAQVAGAIVAASLLRHDGDIAGLIKFGEGVNARVITEHVEDVLGREVATVEAGGHDGKFFFLQALDPLYLEPTEHAALLDRPTYRAQRMLYPLLAGVGGLASPAVTLWTMAFISPRRAM